MNHIKKFEGFFTNKSKRSILSNLFSKEDDEFAQKILNSLELNRIGDISRYGDYKRSVKLQSNGNTYLVTVQKSSKSDYVLIINNKHFIDRNTGKSTVSKKIIKNIWEFLDKEHDKKSFNKEDMKKDFE